MTMAMELELEPIIARFSGTCSLCKYVIWAGNDEETGDLIVKYEGEWVHHSCALDHLEGVA